MAGSWRDPTGIPAGSCRGFGRRVSVPRRESRRDLGGITTGIPPRFWPPGFRFAPRALAGSPAEILAAEFSLPAVSPGGILADYHRDPAEILAAGISLRAESAGGLSRRDFGRRVFVPRRESRRDLGGITTGIPPKFWPPGFRFAPRIPAGTWRELLPRFWPPGFCFLPRISAHSPRFWSPRFPFLAENLAKIPPRFSARQD